ncbi:protein S100-G-like [Cololabis saira]|uniref:protein S100-G-like n=1 Tax=Cololabis saira TaxID=129043 RepID=UPI002AD572BE|nr:protein S100-G-like [Cololabis saira]
MERELSGLEIAVAAMFGVFMSRRGPDGKLSKDAFLKLVKEEMSMYDQGMGDEMFKDIDRNKDGSVEFKEFARLVATMASSSYKILESAVKQMENKKK